MTIVGFGVLLFGRMGLSQAQVDQFIFDGFVRIDEAFPRDVADQARSILWHDAGCKEDDPATWTRPMIRLGMYGQEPFVRAANTPVLQRAFDQLVGLGRWRPRTDLGTFPIRFPSADDPGDTGWHIDSSFPPEDREVSDFLDWHINVTSKARALLMLFLFSDIGEFDAPTRIRVGSHFDVAKMLAPAGERGVSLQELARNGFAETAARREVAATGEQEVCICAIHFWSTQPSPIAVRGRAFSPSHHFHRLSLFCFTARTMRTRRLSAQFASGSSKRE